MFTKEFWLQTGERAIKTFAQALIATGIVVGATGREWQAAVIAAGIAAGLSIVTSVASTGVGDKGTPSLVTPPTPSAVSNDPVALLGEPYVPHPGPNFDTTNFGPPTVDPKSLS